MKRFICLLIAVILICGTAGAVLAEPDTATPTGADTPEGFQLITLQSTGERVMRVQYRLLELGYLTYRPTGVFGQMTRSATVNFQVQNSLMSDGTIGEQSYGCIFGPDAVRAKMNSDLMPKSGPTFSGTVAQPGEAADWAATVDAKLPVGTTFTVVDYKSGTEYSVRRTGGVNHADVETVTAEDSAAFKKTLGGEYNNEKRPALVKYNGAIYAASISGWPMGTDTVADNDMAGCVCLYFSGSVSDVLGIRDPEHDAWVGMATTSNGSYVTQ